MAEEQSERDVGMFSFSSSQVYGEKVGVDQC